MRGNIAIASSTKGGDADTDDGKVNHWFNTGSQIWLLVRDLEPDPHGRAGALVTHLHNGSRK